MHGLVLEEGRIKLKKLVENKNSGLQIVHFILTNDVNYILSNLESSLLFRKSILLEFQYLVPSNFIHLKFKSIQIKTKLHTTQNKIQNRFK